MTCNPPAVVTHSSVVPDLNEYDYNTIISYTCEFGYYKSSGDFNRTCNELAQWTNTAPVCSSKLCVCSNLIYLRRCYYASYTPFVLVSVSGTYIDKRHVCILVTVTSVIVALHGYIICSYYCFT